MDFTENFTAGAHSYFGFWIFLAYVKTGSRRKYVASCCDSGVCIRCTPDSAGSFVDRLCSDEEKDDMVGTLCKYNKDGALYVAYRRNDRADGSSRCLTVIQWCQTSGSGDRTGSGHSACWLYSVSYVLSREKNALYNRKNDVELPPGEKHLIS